MKRRPISAPSDQPSRLVQAGLTAVIVASKRATSMRSVDRRHMRSRSAVRSCDLLLKTFVQLEQAPLGRLACGHVDGRPDHSRADARLVEQAAPLGGDPADNAVLLADGAVLDIVERAANGVARRLVSRTRLLPVIRVNVVVEVCQSDWHIRRDAEHRLDAWRPEHGLGGSVDVPLADLAHVEGEAQFLLAQRQPFLGLASLVDVDHRADIAQVLAVLGKARGRRVNGPTVDTVGTT